MWLSWVRALHTADGTLRLSRPLFHAIEEWAGKEGEPEGKLGWDKGQWVPTLPGMQQQSPRVGGDGSAEHNIESGTASADVEIALEKKGTSHTLGKAREGENGEKQGAISGTAAAAALSGRAPASDLEAEAMMLKAEREEREKVLELVGKLVADFGRFPPAEQEWEGVEDGREKGDRGLSQRNEGGAAVDQGCEDARSSGNGGDGRGGAVSVSGSLNNPPSGREDQPPIVGGSGGSGGRGDDDIHISSEKGRNDDGRCTSNGRDTIETSLSASIRNALILKVEGNESYGQGHLEEAREKYTTALGILDAAAGAAPPQTPSQNSTSENKSGEVSRTEAVVLRGVLHRNRAAVALRLFESKVMAAAAAAAAAKDGKATTAHQRGSTGGDIGGTNTGSGDRQKASAVAEPVQGEGRQAKEAKSTRLALDSSLALLEVCENDCLKAIEVDAGDKKARLRLDRCRDSRRRCYRAGLVAAAAGREGCSTGYSRQDERCGHLCTILPSQICTFIPMSK